MKAFRKKLNLLAFTILLFGTLTVNAQCDLVIDSISSIDVKCYGGADGLAKIMFSGGTAPYVFSWGSGQIIENLSAGIYTVTITDALSCVATATVTIVEPSMLFSSTTVTDALCYGANGVAKVTVSGGTAPYTYLWGDGQTTSSVNLAAETYTVTIKDAQSCVKTETVTIGEPGMLFSTSIQNQTICENQSVHLEAQATGGTFPYDFQWSDNFGNEWFGNVWDITPTQITNYSLTVSDANGCTYSPNSATISIYPPLKILSIITDAATICSGSSAIILVQVVGGDGSYTMKLQDSTVVTSPFTVNPTETSIFIVTVENTCGSTKDSIMINVVPKPQINFSADIVSGTLPLTVTFTFTEQNTETFESYFWNFGDNYFSSDKNPIHNYTEPGQYDVKLEVRDEFGCMYSKTKTHFITVFPLEIDNNTTLIDLTPSEGELIPEFNKLTFMYSVNVSEDTEEIEFFATPTESTANISGAVGSQPLELGENHFTITVTYSDGSKAALNYYITVYRGVTGIDNYRLGNNNLQVYPNPTNGLITVVVGADNHPTIQNGASIQIYDISGRVVQTQLIASQRNANENNITIDISHLQQGMYYLKIGNETVKIIKN